MIHPNSVCDDRFDSIDADSACYTLGFTNGGTYETVNMRDKWSEAEIPILMDDVNCASGSTNFFSCGNNGFGNHNCRHDEDILLLCFESG